MRAISGPGCPTGLCCCRPAEHRAEFIGVYATPLQLVTDPAIFSNTTPVGPYRGAGRPEGNYYIERLLDTAAGKWGSTGRKSAGVTTSSRTKCLTRRLPEQSMTVATSPPCWIRRWSGRIGTVSRSRAPGKPEHGRLRGIGIGQYLEVTGPPAHEMGGIRFESGRYA